MYNQNTDNNWGSCDFASLWLSQAELTDEAMY